jgi:glycosyltransferase involved in cell wall biosynthesis
MNIIQLTPGAGAMYCGNCLRDNTLVAALRKLGHEALMVPLYLPLTLDEADQSADVPVFFGGISVYLEQKLPWFSRAPGWAHRLLAARPLLRWASGRAAKTRPQDVGDLTLSMLRGEQGQQGRELQALIDWLKTQAKPDVICLSNALLLGSARRLRAELRAPIACMFQGEDTFLDSLPASHRAACWEALRQRAAEVDVLISPSHYFADLMTRRLGLPAGRVRVVPNGINLDGFQDQPTQPAAGPPVLGFFARMCREKGLDTLVEAFIQVCRRGRAPGLRLRVGGSCGPSDQPLVNELRRRLQDASLTDRVEFHPNLTRTQKVAFLQSLSVFSVPANYGEAFGLYLVEALAAGVAAAQPRTGAFPELIEATGGGLLYEPGNPSCLADIIETLVADPARARSIGAAGRSAVLEHYSAEAMAKGMLRAWSVA